MIDSKSTCMMSDDFPCNHTTTSNLNVIVHVFHAEHHLYITGVYMICKHSIFTLKITH